MGATALSYRAVFLEDAGQSGDTDAIRERLDAFRTELVALVKSIEAALAVRAKAFSR